MEYLVKTPYLEEVNILFDPLEEKNPLQIVKEHLEGLLPPARIILAIKGYVNSKKVGMDESELVEEIKKIALNRCAELDRFEFKDIQVILEDELFKKFSRKLEQTNYDDKRKSQMRDIAIKAMSESRA